MKQIPVRISESYGTWLESADGHGYRHPNNLHVFAAGFHFGENHNLNFKWVRSSEKLPDVGREVVCRSVDYDPDLSPQHNYWIDVRDICACKQSFRDDDDLTHCREIKWQGKTEHESEFLWSYLPVMGVPKWKYPALYQLPLNHEKVVVAFEKGGLMRWATGVFYAYDDENPANRKCNFFKVYQRENYEGTGQWRDNIDVIAWRY